MSHEGSLVLRVERSCIRLAWASGVILVSALGFGACGSSSGHSSAEPAVESWMASSNPPLGESIGQLRGDDVAIAAFVKQKKPTAAIQTACYELRQDAAQAAANLPSPDQQLTAILQQAYNEYFAASNDCAQGASGGPLLERSATERIKAEADLADAVTRIVQLTGMVPVTTTTIQPPGGGI